jgi:hypothetical protein
MRLFAILAVLVALGVGIAVPLLWADNQSGKRLLSASEVEKRLLDHPLGLPFGRQLKERPRSATCKLAPNSKYRCVVWYVSRDNGITGQFGYDLEVDAYEPLPTRRIGPSTVRHCFQTAGVSFAQTRGDIAFYFRALKRDDSDHPSLYVDRRARLLIDEWASVELVGKPSRWFLWAAQPTAPGRLGVAEIVEMGPPGSYVAYLYHPDRARRSAARRCLERAG